MCRKCHPGKWDGKDKEGSQIYIRGDGMQWKWSKDGKWVIGRLPKWPGIRKSDHALRHTVVRKYGNLKTVFTKSEIYTRISNKRKAILCRTKWSGLHSCYRRNRFLFNNQPDALVIQIYSVIKLYMFRAPSLPIIRSFLLYIRHW
jgi:hypothetical protein